jgi:hypothetical protein
VVRRPLFGLLYHSGMIDKYGAFSGMIIGKENLRTFRKPAPVPLCRPQIRHDLGSNPGRLGWKSATDRISYVTAF